MSNAQTRREDVERVLRDSGIAPSQASLVGDRWGTPRKVDVVVGGGIVSCALVTSPGIDWTYRLRDLAVRIAEARRR